MQRYRKAAKLSADVHPHLLRNQMLLGQNGRRGVLMGVRSRRHAPGHACPLTFLTGQKLSDAQIQLPTGHASKKSLEIYQHLSLDAVDAAYQQAVHLEPIRKVF